MENIVEEEEKLNETQENAQENPQESETLDMLEESEYGQRTEENSQESQADSSLLEQRTNEKNIERSITSAIEPQEKITNTSEKEISDKVVVEEEVIEAYVNKESPIEVNLAKEIDEDHLIYVGNAEDENKVSWSYDNVDTVESEKIPSEKLEGNDKFLVLENLVDETIYSDIYKDIDLQTLVTPTGIKENLILKNSSVQTEFEVQYDIGNLIPHIENQWTILLKDDNGEVIYSIEAPYMMDSKGMSSTDISLEIIRQEGSILVLKLAADENWIKDDEREFPVIIDPTFNTNQKWQNDKAVSSAYVNSATPDKAYGYGSTTGFTGSVYMGSFGQGTYQTYMKINTLPTLNKGDVIVEAYVNLHQINDDFHQNMTLHVHEPKTDWSSSEITWNNKPDCYGRLIDYNVIKPASAGGSDSRHWRQFNVTELAKKWYDGGANNGIMIRDKLATSVQCASFFSSDYPSSSIPRPVLTLAYRNNKGLEDYWTYSSFDVGSAGTAYVNDYSGNLVFVHHDTSTPGTRMPISVEHIFNNYTANVAFKKSSPYAGNGWRLNIQQTLLPSSQFGLTGESATNYPYVYTDGDGTDHYIRKKGSEYWDEDGLKLKLTLNTSNDNAYYTITDEKDNKMIFHKNGNLRQIKDANGNTTNINYASDNTTINSVTDGAGKSITFTAGSDKFVTKMTDAAGRVTTFTTSGGKLTQIKDPDNTTTSFTYDSNGAITKITDAAGYSVEFTYSSLKSGKRVTAVQEKGTSGGLGQKITFDRSKLNSTIVQTMGVSATSIFDDISTTYQFDNYGRTTSVHTKAGNRDLGATSYRYTSGTANSSGSNIKQLNRISLTGSTGSPTKNLLLNHNMEGSGSWTNAEWVASNTFTGVFDPDQKYFGNKSYKLSCSDFEANGRARAYQNVTLEPNKTYTLSGYVKVSSLFGTSGSYGAGLGATPFNSSGSAIKDFTSEQIKFSNTTVNNGWRRVTLTFTTPPETAFVRINMFLRNAKGNAYFDGLQLEQFANATPYNMLTNGSFEQFSSSGIPTGWGSVNLTLDSSNDCSSTTSRSGTAFRIKGDSTKEKAIYQTIPVFGDPNDTYIVSGWANASPVPGAMQDRDQLSSDVRKCKISIKITYTDNTVVWKSPAEFNHNIINDWQFTSAPFTLKDTNDPNKTPKSITVYPRYEYQGNTAIFDDIQLIKDNAQSYTYNDDGKLITVADNAKEKSTMKYSNSDLIEAKDAKGYSYTYTYDSKHNMTKATSQTGIKYLYTYNSTGRSTKLEIKSPDDTLAIKTQAQYTSDNDYLSKALDQDGNATNYTYDANKGTLLQVSGNTPTVNYGYNMNNDILTNVYAKSPIHSIYDSKNTYTYDSTYTNLIGINNNGTQYTMTYDQFGSPVQTKVGSSVLTTNGYSEKNGVLNRIDYGNGNNITYSYNVAGHKSSQTSNGTVQYQWQSDNSGAVTREIDLTSNRQHDYEYDTTGRIVRSVTTDTSAAGIEDKAMFSTEYGYDANNNISSLIYINPKGQFSNLHVYGKDNLVSQTTLSNNITLTSSYDGLGRTTQKKLSSPNPVTTKYEYRASSLGGSYTTTKVASEYLGSDKYSYTYDTKGNITRVTRVSGSKTVNYEYMYDHLNRMVSEYRSDPGYHALYDYDNAGNITGKTIISQAASGGTTSKNISYTYGNGEWKDQLTSSTDFGTITYDTIGNPTKYRGISMEWQNGRQLKKASGSGKSYTYTYSSDGFKTTRTSSSGQKDIYKYENGKLVYETRGDKTFIYSYDSSGTPTMLTYYMSATAGPRYFYYDCNWRGDVVAIRGTAGTVLATYDYDAWGRVLSSTDISSEGIGPLNPLRYRGYYWDSELSLYYLQTRYYDPQSGRFINADGYLQTSTNLNATNMYAYCLDNPVNYFDPTGCWVVSLGIDASITAIWGLKGGISLVWDGNNLGIQYSYAGFGLENFNAGIIGAGIGGNFSWYWGADTIFDLESYEIVGSMSGGPGWYASGDLHFSENGKGITGFTLGGGYGGGFDVSASRPYTGTLWSTTTNSSQSGGASGTFGGSNLGAMKNDPRYKNPTPNAMQNDPRYR